MKKWSVVIVLAIAQFVMVLDGTVMNVSISTVVNDLGTTVASLQAAITFYTLTMAALMLIGAKLCSKWGLMKSFTIGSVIYGIGSLITALSPGISSLFLGWSVIEGLGAVLVIPAVTSLIAVCYKGKDRVIAFTIIGGISGIAAAAGPLIGGFMTTYLSWRYVFGIEFVIMFFVLILSRKFKVSEKTDKSPIDIPSVILSSVGLIMLVYGMLQSKTWGWVTPISKPTILGQEITPFGISIVAFLIIAGIIILKLFYDRQTKLINAKKDPLLDVTLFKVPELRSGLLVLLSQYVITAAIFFIVPIYLQMIIGLDALQTGIRILPLSIALIIFSVLGSKLIQKYSPKQIVLYGQILLLAGAVALLAAIDPELEGYAFSIAMIFVGAGLGLLASQIGNINMSAVSVDKASQVGGISGTYQNLGSSLGTALIGSILVVALTSGFVANISQSTLPVDIKNYITEHSETGVSIVPVQDLSQYALSKGLDQSDANEITDIYKNAQLQGLKESIFYIVAISTLSLLLSRKLPNKIIS